MDVFWLKTASVGRLHFCLGRNDAIYSRQQRRASAHLSRLDGFVFITLRIGSRFLNIDWV